MFTVPSVRCATVRYGRRGTPTLRTPPPPPGRTAPPRPLPLLLSVAADSFWDSVMVEDGAFRIAPMSPPCHGYSNGCKCDHREGCRRIEDPEPAKSPAKQPWE